MRVGYFYVGAKKPGVSSQVASCMDALLLCNAFLDYDAVIALWVTCRTAERPPMLHPHITVERAAEFTERRLLAAEDFDALIKSRRRTLATRSYEDDVDFPSYLDEGCEDTFRERHWWQRNSLTARSDSD